MGPELDAVREALREREDEPPMMLGHITDGGDLVRRELPRPTGDVLINVRAYAVNRGELSLLAQRPDGWMPGQDVAGTLADGTRVVGIADGGGWSQQVVVPRHRIAPLPDEVSFEDAAALPVAGLTALRALREAGPLLGRRLLVTGATGGVGSFAVQLGVAAGAHVTALVSGEQRVDAARALGAHAVVTELDGSFDAVLDGVGGPLLKDAIHHLARRGTVVAYGTREPTELAFYDFAHGPLGRLVGFFIYQTGEETFGDDLAVLAGYVADGRLQVQRTTLPWERTLEAVQSLRDRRITGKAVLTVG
jgi:NADPH:quinone reductase-like Zn-dependent oxidoreductase